MPCIDHFFRKNNLTYMKEILLNISEIIIHQSRHKVTARCKDPAIQKNIQIEGPCIEPSLLEKQWPDLFVFTY